MFGVWGDDYKFGMFNRSHIAYANILTFMIHCGVPAFLVKLTKNEGFPAGESLVRVSYFTIFNI